MWMWKGAAGGEIGICGSRFKKLCFYGNERGVGWVAWLPVRMYSERSGDA